MPKVHQAKETILVVEDGAAVRQLVSQMLLHLGYHVLQAESAEDALRLWGIQQPPIDLVLTDVVMPGMSGVDLARRLERIRPGVRILFMSGYAEPPVLRGVGQSRFLQKPFTSITLGARIREILDGE